MTPAAIFRSRHELKIRPIGRTGLLVQADALAFAGGLRDGIADVIFIDPPFNLGKDYGLQGSIEERDSSFYQLYMSVLLRRLAHVLKPGGALFLYHLPYWASVLAPTLNNSLEFRHWIAVSMKNGFVRGQRLYPAHYALLYYTRGEPATFHRPRTEPPVCRECGALQKDYGGYRHIVERKGINLSDIWEDLSPVRHRNVKLRAANQLPVALTDRVLEIAGRRHGVLVDPFAGTGTSLVSAKRASMAYVGNDLAGSSLTIARKRLASIGRPRGTRGTRLNAV